MLLRGAGIVPVEPVPHHLDTHLVIQAAFYEPDAAGMPVIDVHPAL